MKRSVLFFLCTLIASSSLFLGGMSVKAEVDQGELQQYLINLNWTHEELVSYLQFYNTSLEDFETVADLEVFLGTPINNENLNELLGQYQLDYSDLEILLVEHGETIDDYQFIEDLHLDVEFYLNYQEDFKVVNDFLSIFGLTEEEMQNLFTHISRLDDEEMNSKLKQVHTSIQELQYLQGVEQLSQAEVELVFSLWNDFFEALNIKTTVLLENNETRAEVEFNQLLATNIHGYSIEMSLHNIEGVLLATLNYSDEMVSSHLMYESLEQIADVATIAQQYNGLMQTAKLPITAGHYVTNILLSLFLIISGFMMLTLAKRGVTN